MILNESKENVYENRIEETMEIDTAPNGEPLDYRKLNDMIHELVRGNCRKIILNNVCGQRFIGAAIQEDVEIIIKGVPGNDLGIFMDGPKIRVEGNCEDQSGNTMNNGSMIIDGDAGDVIGLSARGGKIYIRGDVGYRVGIHMKEYENKFPILIAGGTAKDFLGEYMAGGKIILLGLKALSDGTYVESKDSVCGKELGTGIHKGSIYLRTEEDLEYNLGVGARVSDLSEEEHKEIAPLIADFCKEFDIPLDAINNKHFKVVKPISKRPFRGTYCSQMV